MENSVKIKRFFECLLPVTICNLECEYCYIMQRNQRTLENVNLKYSAEQIGKALTQKRLGGVCYFSICGAGETLVPNEIIEIVNQLLNNGHFVNITTNGTLTKRFIEFKEKIDSDLLKRLHFSFSFHYKELKKRNLLETFFENIKIVRSLGCSYIVQINLYDGYIDCIDEIKEICQKKLGCLPQVAATRDEKDKIKLYTKKNQKEYIEIREYV